MQVSEPTFTVSARRLVLSAELLGADLGPDAPVVEFIAPRELLGRLDVSERPFLAFAATLRGRPSPIPWPSVATDLGIPFKLGIDGWTALLGQLPASGVPADAYLISVADLPKDADSRLLSAKTAAAAKQVGLPLLELGSNASSVLAGQFSAKLIDSAVSAGLAALLRPRLTWLETSTDEAGEDWQQQVALIAANPVARDFLLVCEVNRDGTNCGHCLDCLLTMTALEKLSVLNKSNSFDTDTVDPGLIQSRSLSDERRSHAHPASQVRIIRGFDDRPLAGPSGKSRIDAALAPTGWRTSTTLPEQTESGEHAPELVIGWNPGEVPLRPMRSQQRTLRARLADHSVRPTVWVVADFADPGRVNDPWPARVADAAEQLWGPGLCYLAGIGWAETAEPGLPTAAVARLLRVARIRLWWSEQPRLDPLRLLESIEHGCLPLQVSPPAVAAAARDELPQPLWPLVTDLGELAEFDSSAAHSSLLLTRAAALIFAGSVERDLALDSAFLPVAGPGSVHV